MEALRPIAGRAAKQIRTLKYRIRNAWFNAIRKNPYPDGSVGSLFWKIDHGKPLNEEEQRDKVEWDETSRLIAERMGTSARAQIYIGYAWVAGQLIRNLPKDMRDALGPMPLREAREMLELLLPLASYRREQTAVKLAGYAVIIGALAFLISVASLGLAVWVSISFRG